MKEIEVDGKVYRVPDELSPFQLSMYVHLINWKWDHGQKDAGHHSHMGKRIPYDTILPDDVIAREELPHIFTPAQYHFRAHRIRNPFRIHEHFYHMASSQAATINLFLHILHHPLVDTVLNGIPGVPEDFESLAKDQLDNGYCLEFWGGNFNPEQAGRGVLGDKSKKAGTDTDIAIAYRNNKSELGLWLIEHKLTEKEFTTCGGYKSIGRTDKVRHDCNRSFESILTGPEACYYHDMCRYKYWDITRASPGFFVNTASHAGCPFIGGMNQLWRNQLLSLAILQKETTFKHSHFSVVRHPENKAIDATLKAYSELIAENPRFSTFTSADVVRSATAIQDDSLVAWADWYRNLYRV